MRNFFKKPINVNFISILVVVILLAGLSLVSTIFAFGTGNEFSAMASQIEDMRAVVFFAMTLFLFIPLLTARLLYHNTGGGLLAYRIIMSITYLLLLLLVWLLFSMVGQSVSVTVFALLGALLIIAIIVINVINTYSDRIKN